MQSLIQKNYDFKEVENEVIEKFYSDDFVKEFFDLKFSDKNFSVVIPPPNVTGSLHMGHALNSTIQDFLLRFHLLKGYEAVWFIGTDHAGIATQNVVEKYLLKQGINRFKLSKEEFLNEIWKWKEKYGNIILEQFKRLGLYANIKNSRFTMDEVYTIAVKKAFVELYKKGYVYKGKRVVNWCPRCLTSLSDLEVVYKSTKTKLYYIKYKLENSQDFLVIATTRPETILADTAVAINPQDSRYSKYIGQRVIVPLINRIVPIISSKEVDPEFGTGVLKVTPAHDFNDFKIYQKNENINIINVLNHKAQIDISGIETQLLDNPYIKQYHLLDRFQVREKIVNDLQNEGLIQKIEDHQTNIGHCYRCDTVIEPYYSDQWFISMKELVKKPREIVEKEKIKFYPPIFKKVIIDWYDNIEDWCISRQIVWGHKIPIYNCKDCGWIDASEEDVKTCPNCGSLNIYQEEDVLDTWFSSALWPFAVMYWPNQIFEKYKKYYPTDILTTAREILFLWVSRMIVMSLFFLNEIPFKDVIIHPVILAPSGKRMSKSLGTGIDPLELIEKYGADSVRMGLIIQIAESQDVKFNFEKIEMARNFINKLWNAIRYFQIKKNQNIQNNQNQLDYNVANLINNWLIYQLSILVNQLENYVKEYRFFDYTMSLYHFVWNVFCDWYIEFTKFMNYRDFEYLLDKVLKIILMYLHPLIPFSTYYIYEKIFQENIMNQNIDEIKNSLLNNQDLSNFEKDFEISWVIADRCSLVVNVNLVSLVRSFKECKTRTMRVFNALAFKVRSILITCVVLIQHLK